MNSRKKKFLNNYIEHIIEHDCDTLKYNILNNKYDCANKFIYYETIINFCSE